MCIIDYIIPIFITVYVYIYIFEITQETQLIERNSLETFQIEFEAVSNFSSSTTIHLHILCYDFQPLQVN